MVRWETASTLYYQRDRTLIFRTGVRAMALQRHGPGHHVTPMEKIGASTIGGAVAAGVMSGIIRKWTALCTIIAESSAD